jgi:hypothetical protein
VELKDVTQDLEVVRVRLIEIEPEESSTREEPLDCLAAELHLLGAAVVDDEAGRTAGLVRRYARNRPFAEAQALPSEGRSPANRLPSADRTPALKLAEETGAPDPSSFF